MRHAVRLGIRICMRHSAHGRAYYDGGMRTTVEFDDDTARAVEQLRRAEGLGVSEAVNELIRRGLLPRPESARFQQRTHSMGLRVDVSNVAEALEVLEGVEHR